MTPIGVSTFLRKFGIGNHRFTLVDFNLDEMINQSVNICTPSMRRLICENKKSTESQNELSLKLLKSNKAQQRLEKLESLLATTDLDSWCVKLNMLDE